MILQTILEGLGLGGAAGSGLRHGHPQGGGWNGASLQPGGTAAVLAAIMTFLFTEERNL